MCEQGMKWTAVFYCKDKKMTIAIQSQNGINNGNSNILIFIFQVNGICLHEKMGIQQQSLTTHI